jgi:hypothetical protein
MKVLNTFVKRDITIRMVVIEQMIKEKYSESVIKRPYLWISCVGFFDDAVDPFVLIHHLIGRF